MVVEIQVALSNKPLSGALMVTETGRMDVDLRSSKYYELHMKSMFGWRITANARGGESSSLSRRKRRVVMAMAM